MRRLFIAVATAGVVVGASVPASAEPPAPATCFSYTPDQWLQSAFTAVPGDCLTPHNGEVLGAASVPPDVAATGYASAGVKRWAFQACQPIAVDYVWTKPKPKFPKASYVMPRSARLNVQFPSVEAWNAGERWVACLGQSRNISLSAPRARTGSVAGAGLKPYVCLNPRNWRGMNCKKTDAVRLTNQVWIGKRAYPGTPKMLKKTRSACRKLAKKRKAWTMRTYYVPGLTAWDRGNQNGYCEILK